MSLIDTTIAPPGTRLWLLDLGHLMGDEGWLLRGAGALTRSQPSDSAKWRETVVISALIEHPVEGLILFETGAGKNFFDKWEEQYKEASEQVSYHPDQELDAAIRKCGFDIKDVKMVIMGHLHLDHAGGLEYFFGTNVPIYVHEKELKNAFYSVANKSDLGPYLPSYMSFDLNWKCFNSDVFPMAQGITLHHMPGHTPGLCIMQLNLGDSGSWIFTTDQYHVKESFYESLPQGWVARDHDGWLRSHSKIQLMQKRLGARIIFGHCLETLSKYELAPYQYM